MKFFIVFPVWRKWFKILFEVIWWKTHIVYNIAKRTSEECCKILEYDIVQRFSNVLSCLLGWYVHFKCNFNCFKLASYEGWMNQKFLPESILVTVFIKYFPLERGFNEYHGRSRQVEQHFRRDSDEIEV